MLAGSKAVVSRPPAELRRAFPKLRPEGRAKVGGILETGFCSRLADRQACMPEQMRRVLQPPLQQPLAGRAIVGCPKVPLKSRKAALCQMSKCFNGNVEPEVLLHHRSNGRLPAEQPIQEKGKALVVGLGNQMQQELLQFKREPAAAGFIEGRIEIGEDCVVKLADGLGDMQGDGRGTAGPVRGREQIRVAAGEVFEKGLIQKKKHTLEYPPFDGDLRHQIAAFPQKKRLVSLYSVAGTASLNGFFPLQYKYNEVLSGPHLHFAGALIRPVLHKPEPLLDFDFRERLVVSEVMVELLHEDTLS